MIKASCGHSIDKVKNVINIKDYDKEGNKIALNMVVCDDCLVWFVKNNLILRTERDVERWLKE